MARITQISLLILILGMVIGLFTGGLSGIALGFILSGVIAIPFYCLANTFKANMAPGQIGPFSDSLNQITNDKSQLPKSAYDLISNK